MKSSPIPAALFIRNRSRLASLMVPGSVALIRSGEQKTRNGDQFYPYRQHSDFFFLTGLNQGDAFFAFCPDHPNQAMREQLFIRKPTPKSDLWTGPVPDPEESSELSGIAQVSWTEEQQSRLQSILRNANRVYADFQAEGVDPGSSVSLSHMLERLRAVKEPEEIETIRRAASITHSAFLRVLERTEPGMMEYQVEAEIIAEFIAMGAEGHAYEPIVASGENALVLHYVSNNNICRDGDLLLMDFGAEVNNYASDCSRTIPVNGRFSKRQRALYDSTLKVFRQARDLMMPGVLMNDFHQQVGAIWEEEHLALGLYSKRDVSERSDTDPLWKKYYMHGTSHSMGLDVHDPFDRTRAFEPGMVLTCEPAIYLPEEGMGIRLENDILIGSEGPVDLMQDIPMEADELENLMNRGS